MQSLSVAVVEVVVCVSILPKAQAAVVPAVFYILGVWQLPRAIFCL
jgi:cytochrome oxidase assembly protein ShyY1